METKIILTEESSIINALTTLGTESIKSELNKNIEFSQALTITDNKDKKQLQTVRDTKNGYVKTRNTVKRAFKSKRDINTQENKNNIIAEKEVLEDIQKEENRLNDLIIKAELELLKEKNSLILKDRIEALKKCEYETTDEILLEMTDKDFDNLLNDKRLEFITIEENRIKAEKEKIAREKEIEDAKKQAKLEAEKEAKKQAEIEKERVEKQKIDAENKRLEDLEKARIDKENEIARIKKEQEDKEEKEKQKIFNAEQEKEKLESQKQERIKKENEDKKYIEFLKKCGITKENKQEFFIKRNEQTGFREVYKLVDVYKI